MIVEVDHGTKPLWQAFVLESRSGTAIGGEAKQCVAMQKSATHRRRP